MPERNNKGYLTVSSLREGKIDQHAVLRGGKQISVTLGAYAHAPYRPFYVKFTISHAGLVEESRLQTFVSVDQARTRFRQLQRSHP